jgi:hypothetical protein
MDRGYFARQEERRVSDERQRIIRRVRGPTREHSPHIPRSEVEAALRALGERR